MERSVRITQRAFDEIEGIVTYIAKEAPAAAERWRDGILKKIATLENLPLRHGLALEADTVGVEIRQTFYGAYRILYTVDDRTVTVHGVRHGARRPLGPDEWQQLM